MADGAGNAQLLKHRTRHTRWLAILLLPAILVAQPLWMPDALHKVMDMTGVLCLVACCVGRIWCSIYIGGRKNGDLVAEGPYSVVRNPLYVFSFIGVVGIALLSKMATVLIIAPLIFAIYYRTVVAREEAFLMRQHGDAYGRYVKSVPRWIPDFSLWRDVPALTTSPKVIMAHVLDSSAFFLALILFEALDVLNLFGGQLVLFRLP